MLELEAIAQVRDFIETGGNVLLAIALTTFMMWTLILERTWYFRLACPKDCLRAREVWEARDDHASWNAHQIRRLLVSEVQVKLDAGLSTVKALVGLCPLLGLLGTVTGMIEVFDVMAISGSGNARAMASGVSKATIPTMAGMVAALSGLIFSVQLQRFAQDQGDRVADSLIIVHE